MKQKVAEKVGIITGSLIMVLLIGGNFGAWLTHVIVCIMDEKYLFLIVGAFMFPVAIVHGVGVWFGLW